MFNFGAHGFNVKSVAEVLLTSIILKKIFKKLTKKKIAKQLPWTVLTVLKKHAVLEVISGPKMSQIWHKDNTVHLKMVIFNKWCMRPGLFKNQRPQHRHVGKYDTFKWAVEQISKFLQRRFREVGFRIPEARFRIPKAGFRIQKAGFRIPKAWIPDYKGKNILDSGFQIPLHGATARRAFTYGTYVFSKRWTKSRKRSESGRWILQIVGCRLKRLISLFELKSNKPQYEG